MLMMWLLWEEDYKMHINILTSEVNSSAQRCRQRFLLDFLTFKRLTARRLYKSFGVKVISLLEQTNNMGLEINEKTQNL
jgi:hypothetical protein